MHKFVAKKFLLAMTHNVVAIKLLSAMTIVVANIKSYILLLFWPHINNDI